MFLLFCNLMFTLSILVIKISTYNLILQNKHFNLLELHVISKPKVTLHFSFLIISSFVLNCDKASIGVCL